MAKKSFHALAEHVPRDRLDPEIKKKLEVIANVAKQARPLRRRRVTSRHLATDSAAGLRDAVACRLGRLPTPTSDACCQSVTTARQGAPLADAALVRHDDGQGIAANGAPRGDQGRPKAWPPGRNMLRPAPAEGNSGKARAGGGAKFALFVDELGLRPRQRLKAAARDSGPESASKVVACHRRQVRSRVALHPARKAHLRTRSRRSATASFRDGCLNQHWFKGLANVKRIAVDARIGDHLARNHAAAAQLAWVTRRPPKRAKTSRLKWPFYSTIASWTCFRGRVTPSRHCNGICPLLLQVDLF